MTVKMLPPGPLQEEYLIDGRARLLRPLNLRINGWEFVCPEGLVYDGSSWPRCLPGPRQSRIRVAGAVHDTAFQLGTHGEGGDPISFWQANELWYVVSRAGSDPGARASAFWARAGWLGLTIGSYWTWRRYRKAD